MNSGIEGKGCLMCTRHSFSLLAASLVLFVVVSQAQAVAQYTISTLAVSTFQETPVASLMQGVALDNSGNVYNTWNLTNGQEVVVEANSTGVALVGSNSSNFPGCGLPANNIGLDHPGGLAFDASGSLYIGNQGGGPFLRVVNGTATCPLGLTPPGNSVRGIAVDNAGNVYFAAGDSQVYKLAPGATAAVPIAGTGTPGCSNGEIDDPHGIAVDGNGNLYIADPPCEVIWKLNLSSPGNLTPAAGIPNANGFFGDTGSATLAKLDHPMAVAVDSAGNLYIADRNNHRIREVSGGTINTIAGNGAQGFSGDGRPALQAELDTPSGIAVAPGGTIYISEMANNQRIRVLTPPWAIITSPTPGSVLGASATFTWSGAPTGSTYRFEVNDQPALLSGTVFYSNSAQLGQSQAVGNLPCDGRTIYAHLATYDMNGNPQDPGPYTYHACKMINMTVSPTTLPQTGGSVDILIMGGNYYPGATITLTESLYGVRCLPACSPTVLASWTTPTGWASNFLVYRYTLNVPALPPTYHYARQFLITATVTYGGQVKDSSSAVMTQD
jgi:NHL repeat-containing protein